MKNETNYIKNDYEKVIKLKERIEKIDCVKLNSYNVLFKIIVSINNILLFCNRNVDKEILQNNLAELLLQLSFLSKIEDINMTKIEKYKELNFENVDSINIVYTTLIESIIKKYDKSIIIKKHKIENIQNLIEDNIVKLFRIVFNYSEKWNIDICFEINKKIIKFNRLLDCY